MPPSASREPALPAAWSDVLDRIQGVLAEALQGVEARLRALQTEPTVSGSPSWNLRIDNATVNTGPGAGAHAWVGLEVEMEQALAAAQEGLDRWLASAAQVWQKLAEHAARVV
ncbi:MAG TPA: hypothetical protein VKE94_21345 [Gemmataceae bacterium]|nr:hypothetical protein [Gemmataceae bacterium]